MSIIKNSIVALAAALTFGACANESYTISGEIDGVTDGKMFMARLNLDTPTPVVLDTAEVVEGKFTFEGSMEENDIRILYHNRNSRDGMFLYLDNSKVQIAAEYGKFAEAKVSGSESNLLRDEVFNGMQRLQDQVSNNRTTYRNAVNEGDQELQKEILKDMDKIVQDQKDFLGDFISAHPDENLSAYILADVGRSLSFDEINPLYEQFTPAVKNSQYGKKIAEALTELKKTAPGFAAPEFSLGDAEGTDHTLSAMKGKKVLLHIWSLHNPRNPAVVADIQAIKDKYADLDIVSICVEAATETVRWQSTISNLGMDWLNLKGDSKFRKDYALRAPTQILIDTEGKIVGNYLNTKDLQEALEK